MTIYTKQVYGAMPFKYTVKKDRYYDVNVIKSVTVDTIDNITLEPYPGLAVTEDSGISVSEGVLPNGENFPGASGVYGEYGKKYLANGAIKGGLFTNHTGALAKWNLFYKDSGTPVEFNKEETVAGKAWIGNHVFPSHIVNPYPEAHFSANGNVTFSEYIISFASGAYLAADKKLPNTAYFAQDFDFISKITPASLSSYQCVARIKEANTMLGTYNSAWCLYIGGSKTAGGTVAPETTYWFRVRQIGSTSTLYVLEDDGSFTLSTLPDISNWTQAVQVSKSAFASQNALLIGTEEKSYYWKGGIDLKNTVLKSKLSTADCWNDFWFPLTTNELA